MRFKTEVDVVMATEYDDMVKSAQDQIQAWAKKYQEVGKERDEALAKVEELEAVVAGLKAGNKELCDAADELNKECNKLNEECNGLSESYHQAIRERDEALDKVTHQGALVAPPGMAPSLETDEERSRTPSGPGNPRYPGEY